MNKRKPSRIVNFLKAVLIEACMAVIIFSMMYGVGTWLNYFIMGFSQ